MKDDARDRVELKVRGSRYAGWQEITVTRGIEMAAATFDLRVSERFPGQRQPLRIVPGDACEVFIGGDKVITGYVDDVAPEYDDHDHSVRVNGRSKTGDLVDCSAINVPGQWRGATMQQIATDMASVYGVNVRSEVDTAPAFPEFQLQQGETVFAAIERMARIKAVLVTDDEDGNLVITRAGKEGSGGAIVLGANVKKGGGTFSMKDRFSEYLVKGQQAGDDDKSAGTIAATRGSAKDSLVKRKRVLLLVAEAQADDARCEARARWEAVSRAGKATECTYTVQGWRENTGALWRPNTLIPISDAFLGVHTSMLATTIMFTITEEGSITVITVQPPGAFELLSELEDDASAEGGDNAGTNIWKSLGGDADDEGDASNTDASGAVIDEDMDE